MALKAGVISVIVFSSLLSALAHDDAHHIEDHSMSIPGHDMASSAEFEVHHEASIDDHVAVADVQAHARLYLKAHLEATATKMREFLARVILRRLNNQSTEESAQECLTTCQEAYQAGVHAIEKGIYDVSHDSYGKARQDIEEFASDIYTCKKCFGEMIVEDPEFKQFQEWAASVAADCQGKLQITAH